MSLQSLWTYFQAVDRSKESKLRLIHWASGYAYGKTGEGDLYIALYHPHEGMEDKVVKVYDHQWKNLPEFVERPNANSKHFKTNNRTPTPTKSMLRKQGLYHECFMFQFVCFLEQENSAGLRERRFFKTVLTTKKYRPDHRPEPSSPTVSFNSMQEAVQWVREELNLSEAEAIEFYNEVKNRTKPSSASEMWSLLVTETKDRMALEGNIDAFTQRGGH